MESFEDNAGGTTTRKQYEIDFVATKGNQKCYIQSAFQLPDSDKMMQETNSLRRISDSFEKMIIVGENRKARRTEDGFIIATHYGRRKREAIDMLSQSEGLKLNEEIIEKINTDAAAAVKEVMHADLSKMVLFGSCARGDYTADSDIDIAILTNCNRLKAKNYNEPLSLIAADIAEKYFTVVNFISIPKAEFDEKKSWYGFFGNIEREGKQLYG